MYSVFVHGEGQQKGDVNQSCERLKILDAILGDVIAMDAIFSCNSSNVDAPCNSKQHTSLSAGRTTPHPHSLCQPTAPLPKRACTFRQISE
jgi:hypothetical protein